MRTSSLALVVVISAWRLLDVTTQGAPLTAPRALPGPGATRAAVQIAHGVSVLDTLPGPSTGSNPPRNAIFQYGLAPIVVGLSLEGAAPEGYRLVLLATVPAGIGAAVELRMRRVVPVMIARAVLKPNPCKKSA